MKKFRLQRPLEDAKQSMFNVPYHICDHLVGENHTIAHRIFVGVLIIIGGTYVAQIHIGYVFVDVCMEATGYVIHGIGAYPLVEHVVSLTKKS